MPSDTQTIQANSVTTLLNSYKSIETAVGGQRTRRIFLGAKDSLIGESSLPEKVRIDRLKVYEEVEKQIWGSVHYLPGEEKLVSQGEKVKLRK